jgi:hypothetical protein
MKLKTTFLLLILYLTGYSQPKKPEVVKITTHEKLFSGKIDGKYDYTMYLKLFQFSEDNSAVYSVKGWYYYDDKQIHIPIVGFYDGELTLFTFKSKVRENNILAFETNEPVENLWTTLEILKRTEDYDEKFQFSDVGKTVTGTWQKGKISLSASLISEQELDIYQEQEFLQIPDKGKTHSINLYNLDLFVTDFTFEAYFQSKTEIRILLDYEFTSRSNSQGMCGAGIEKGYIVLHYDNNFNFVSSEDLRIESCLYDAMYETDPADKNLFHVRREDKNENWRIDSTNAQIIKLK